MMHARGGWRVLLLGALAGGIGALGLAPFGLWPATLLALAGAVFLFDRATSARQALALGWAFGTGYFAIALMWIVEPFLVEPEIYGWMAPFALVFMSAGLAIFWAIAFRVSWSAPDAIRGFALVIAWSLAELARAYVLTGFPWAGFAQIWVGHGPDQMLALLGPHGLGLVTLACGLALARALSPGIAWSLRVGGIAVTAALLAGGFWLGGRLPEPVLQQAATIRVVQPNAPQEEKWNPDRIPVFLDRKLGFSAQDPAPDLIVWPETSVPALLAYAGPILEDISRAAGDVPVVAGVMRRDGARLFNSALLIRNATPAEIYDKHHLVPFGEYIPFGDLAARLGLHGFAAREGQGFSAGPGPLTMDLGRLGRALPLICYEAVFPHLSRAETRPDMLIQITNDAWFGQWSGPYQHLAQARMRAIEQGLPMIRAANTGVSAMIDPYGRISASIPLGEAGFVDAALPAAREEPLYARTGDWPVLGLLLLACLVLWRAARTRARTK